MNPSRMTPAQRARVEQALVDLSNAVDGSGRRIRLGPQEITQKGIRAELRKHIDMVMPQSRGDVVFIGEHGEEAWLTNLVLLANALLAACEADGGSELNHVIPF